MTITEEHITNMRSHVAQQHEAALIQAGKAMGKLELLKELEGLLTSPEPKPGDEKTKPSLVLTPKS